MKTLKSLLPFVLAVFALAGCKTDDLEKDIDALTVRVEGLEAQVSLLNDNLNALRVFMDGGVTISKVEKTDTEPITYTLTLSNNDVITLTQGSTGSVATPTITIENNVWVINGVPTDQVAIGNDGTTPEFRIDGDGYWTVDFGKGANRVKDENGNDAKATTSETIETGDQFFKDVKEATVDGVKVLQVTLYGDDNNDVTYSLPIVEDLVCEIVEPSAEDGFSNGVWTIGYGEIVTANVKVKGDNYVVTAPDGWTASVEITDEGTGEGTLTVTAPAQASAASRAAVADNSTDLVLQVNKGITWAVDKIQVKAAKVITSYYDEFNAGETLTFGGYELKKNDFEDSEIHVIDESSESKDIAANGIYFVKAGVTANWTCTAAVKETIIIGDDPRVQTSALSFADNQYVRLNSGSTESGVFLCANLKINPRSTNYTLTSNAVMGKVIFDNCLITPVNKNFYYCGGTGVTNDRNIGEIIIANSKINLSNTTTQFFQTNTTYITRLSLKLDNNIFYASSQASSAVGTLFNFRNSVAESSSVEIKNNTFVNVYPGSNGLVYGGGISSVTIENNLFSNTSYGSYLIVVRANDDNSAIPTSMSSISVKNNFCNSGATGATWKAFMSNEFGGDGNSQITRNIADLITSNFETLTFTPLTGYEQYGAQQ